MNQNPIDRFILGHCILSRFPSLLHPRSVTLHNPLPDFLLLICSSSLFFLFQPTTSSRKHYPDEGSAYFTLLANAATHPFPFISPLHIAPFPSSVPVSTCEQKLKHSFSDDIGCKQHIDLNYSLLF